MRRFSDASCNDWMVHTHAMATIDDLVAAFEAERDARKAQRDARESRLTSARASVDALSDEEELVEIGVYIGQVLKALRKNPYARASSTTDKPTTDKPRAIQVTSSITTDTIKKYQDARRKLTETTYRQAVIKVLADGTPRTTGEIADEIRLDRDDVNLGTLGGEMKRLRDNEMIVQDGSSARGHAKYTLTPKGMEAVPRS